MVFVGLNDPADSNYMFSLHYRERIELGGLHRVYVLYIKDGKQSMAPTFINYILHLWTIHFGHKKYFKIVKNEGMSCKNQHLQRCHKFSKIRNINYLSLTKSHFTCLFKITFTNFYKVWDIFWLALYISSAFGSLCSTLGAALFINVQ